MKWAALSQHVRKHVHKQFDLDPDVIHLSTMVVASPPRVVRDAIARHRREIDSNPIKFVLDPPKAGQPAAAVVHAQRVADAAARYLGLPVSPATPGTTFIAQTGSTTMGLALLANGITAQPGQSVVTSVHDFSAMREAWRLRCGRSGLVSRTIQLFRDPTAGGLHGEILENVKSALVDGTRVLALTWVHSNTGVKLPVAEIGTMVREWNVGRPRSEQVVFCLDGVHGFGVEPDSFEALGCDFLVAGCHKWLFGPRGTGIVCALPRAWDDMTPTVPSFLPPQTPGFLYTPGGVPTYEHVWAMAEAFEFHLGIGKAEIAAYTRGLAGRLKRGLAALPKVRVVTPMAESLSSGVVCCDVIDVDAATAVQRLREHGIVAMRASGDPGRPVHLRFSPSILNDADEIDRTVDVVAGLP